MPSSPRAFFETYTKDFTKEDLGKLFTYETPEAYRFFARGINTAELEGLPVAPARGAVSPGVLPRVHDAPLAGPPSDLRACRCSPAVIGIAAVVRRVRADHRPMPCFPLNFIRIGVPGPIFAHGTLWLLGRFPADEPAGAARGRRSAVAQARPGGGTRNSAGHAARRHVVGPGVEAFGLTRPANTVGGDFYDILPQPDGRVIVALGDVAGKASPAALLMALLLAMLRTLVDEGLEHRGAGRAAECADRATRPARRASSHFLSPRTTRAPARWSSSTPVRLRRCCGGKMAASSG